MSVRFTDLSIPLCKGKFSARSSTPNTILGSP